MTDTDPVTLEPAGRDQEPVLANLLELYCHDLSDLFGLEVGPEGRFGYRRLSLYWSEPETRRAFLIRRGTRLAGFALVHLGSSLAGVAADCDVAEFFVLRGHRRFGVGRRAAHQLWDRFPGTWTVRVAASNDGARAFWASAIRDYATGPISEHRRVVDGRDWEVFAFGSRRSS